MKKAALLLATLVWLAAPARAQLPPPDVTISFGTPYSAGPSETADGWWVPILISNPNQHSIISLGSQPYYSTTRNIHFGGNIKPVMYCYDPPWLPGTTQICSAQGYIPSQTNDYLMLNGTYWAESGIAMVSDSHTSPDTAFFSINFGNIYRPVTCVTDATSGLLGHFRAVKRHAGSQYGTITLAETQPLGTFSSMYEDCEAVQHQVAVGYPLTLPPPGGGGGSGGGGHEEGVTAAKRTAWGTIKKLYR